MPSIITFTSEECEFLQEIVNEMYQDDSIRSLEGPLIHGILVKLQTAGNPPSVTFGSIENERIQYMTAAMNDQLAGVITPTFIPFIPLVDSMKEQRGLIHSIQLKLMAEAE